jgi:hypothetical protein
MSGEKEHHMRKLLTTCALLGVLFGSVAAHAAWVLEGSAGQGYHVNEPRGWEPTNIMLAPGYEFLGLLRAQLGLVGDLGNVQNRQFDLELRPMIGVYPPIIPLYARAIFAVENMLHHTQVAVGGAVGVKIGIPVVGLGVFAEAGVLPRFSPTTTVVEGRVGAYFVF